MKAHLRHAWETVRKSFWFLPLIMVGLATLLSWATLWLDQLVDMTPGFDITRLFYRGSQQGAQVLLSTIAGSMIGVAGTVFSITIAVLAFTASTFGARLLHHFVRDQSTHAVLGIYVATYVYCLLVLRVLDGDGLAQVPHNAVNIALLLAILCLAALIYFIHHIASAIQTANVLATVARDLEHAIEQRMPKHIERPILSEKGGVAQTLAQLFANAQVIEARSSGYVQNIDEKKLRKLATDHDFRIWMDRGLGDFVIEGHTLAFVASEHSLPRRLTRRLESNFNGALILGAARTQTQGVAFALNQLVEIALRALSPAINDPFTAMSCLDWLGAALYQITERNTPSPYYHDKEGYLRLVTKPVTFEYLVGLAFDQIRVTAKSSVAVTNKLLETLAVLMSHVSTDEHQAILRTQAEATYRGIVGTLPDARDRDEIRLRYDAVLAAAKPEPDTDTLD